MDYEAMWNELKTSYEKDLENYKNGIMQSVGESIEGMIKTRNSLKRMERIEEKYR
jgi:hypothetical protein